MRPFSPDQIRLALVIALLIVALTWLRTCQVP